MTYISPLLHFFTSHTSAQSSTCLHLYPLRHCLSSRFYSATVWPLHEDNFPLVQSADNIFTLFCGSVTGVFLTFEIVSKTIMHMLSSFYISALGSSYLHISSFTSTAQCSELRDSNFTFDTLAQCSSYLHTLLLLMWT